MCYSSQIIAEWKHYTRAYGVEISLEDYYDLFWRRRIGERIRIPKALEDGFAAPQTERELEIKKLIDQWRASEAARLQQELFRQRQRLTAAGRALASKPTKKATEDERIASNRTEQILGWLADLQRSEPKPQDSRIYPQQFTHVIVSVKGKRVLRPMRYGCRLAGKPAFYDTKYPGTYNARRDSLEGFWKSQFGRHHAIMVATSFYENVDRGGRNVVLEFKPATIEPMLVACVWSHWSAPGEPDLLSFAAITDEPPPEVAATGHDRCIIPIRPEHMDAWLNPGTSDLAASFAILDDRERPYYEHRLAA
jgi:putative SOS response-associated peptidase YedK